jgi:uncharacterized membrane protein YagU involved in acid resistance
VSTSSIGKGVLAGIAGGLIASWGMNQFQKAWSKRQQPQSNGDGKSESPTVKVAEAVSETALDHRLTGPERENAAEIVHYAFGGLVGAVYGMAAAARPEFAAGAGVPFGAAVWLLADEAMLPALGLSKPATEYPAATHAYALASHCVYGVVTDLVRRGVGKALGAGN